jgi:hypothetical protein
VAERASRIVRVADGQVLADEPIRQPLLTRLG